MTEHNEELKPAKTGSTQNLVNVHTRVREDHVESEFKNVSSPENKGTRFLFELIQNLGQRKQFSFKL